MKEADSVLVIRYRSEGADRPVDASHIMILRNFVTADFVLGIEEMSSEKGKDFASALASLISAPDAASGPIRASDGEGFDVGLRFRKGDATLDVLLTESAMARVESRGAQRVVSTVIPLKEETAKALRAKSAKAFPTEPDDASRAALGAFACRLLKEADKGECVLVRRVEGGNGSDPAVGGFGVRATGNAKLPGLAKALRPLLFDGARYVKDREFSAPAIAFRISKDGERLDVLVSFESALIQVRASDPKAPEAKVATASLGGARAAFLRLAKLAFPDDPIIGELKD